MTGNKNHFSFVIPVYNGIKTLPALLDRLDKLHHYTSEIILIDSGSDDGSWEYLLEIKRTMKNLIIKSISRGSFNHGLTRNIGAGLASGDFVCYFSQDAVPADSAFLSYFLEDFRKSKRIVAVYGKQIPAGGGSLFQQAEFACRFQELQRYVGKDGVAVLDPKNPVIPVKPSTYHIWYSLFDTFACYRRSFLLEHPFPETPIYEDLLQGKKIVSLNLVKIYDPRCRVYHSHSLSLRDYFRSQTADLAFRGIQGMGKRPGKMACKVKYILSAGCSLPLKIVGLASLPVYYLVKAAALFLARMEASR